MFKLNVSFRLVAYLKLTAFALLFLVTLCRLALSQNWQPLERLPVQGNIDVIGAHPAYPNTLFIGAHGRLYHSENAGKDWVQRIQVGPHVKINRVEFDRDQIYLLTSDGLYESDPSGKNWKKTFGELGSDEQNVLALCRDPDNAKIYYLGTGGGLFKSSDRGKNWFKVANELAHQTIDELKTDFENGEIFIAAQKGLYRFTPRKEQLDRLRTTAGISPDESPEETDPADETNVNASAAQNRIHTVWLTSSPASVIGAAASDAIWVSDDEGNHWDTLPTAGLREIKISDLVYSSAAKTFYIATAKGVFRYNETEKRWEELENGLPFAEVNRLKLIEGETETLYAATPEGVYRTQIGPETINGIKPSVEIPTERWQLLSDLFRHEPTVGAVQNQAIRYANVRNLKTKSWQWGSRIRALVPTFSVGKDLSINSNVDLDRGGTSDPDKFIFGPPDRNSGWNFDINWNLADLIWSSSQTSIDSREKMMVELRNDILSELTRLYFERRRSQTEFILNPPEEATERMNALLRIDELTANIDTFTGGYLTKTLETIYRQNRTLKDLWSVNET